MIHVAKDYNDAPAILTSPKAEALLTKILEAKSVKVLGVDRRKLYHIYSHESVKEKLGELYHNKCAYCESKLEKMTIHHYRPKSVYYWLVFEWSNLLPLCQACNESKANIFPIKKNDKQVTSPQIHRIDWRANSSSFLAEEPLLLHPEIDDPKAHIYYRKEGYIYPYSPQGKETIKTLKLNREFLLGSRNKSIQDLMLLHDFLDPNFKEKLQESSQTWNVYSLLGSVIRERKDDFFSDFSFMEVALANVKKQIKKETVKLEFEYIKNFLVEQYYCIYKQQLTELGNKKEVYFFGENGVGKTILLQALLLALKWNDIDVNTKKSFTGIVEDNTKNNKGLYLEINEIIRFKHDVNFIEEIWAYGTQRRGENSKQSNLLDEYGYLTLFREDIYLQSPEKWLQEIYFHELEGTKPTISLATAKKLLQDLLDDENHQLDIKVSVREVTFTERGTSPVKFSQLSDGYKSVMTWVCDLLTRLAENQPTTKKTQGYIGIVLVDEIGLHLHPKWQKTLVKKLRKWFPKIQFFFTTHSPIFILGASEDAVFYRLYKEDGATQISEPYYAKDLAHLTANGVITSPLFDLEDAFMSINGANKLEADMSSHFIHGKIRERVTQEVKQLKEKGTTYISEQEIEDMIENALAEFKTVD